MDYKNNNFTVLDEITLSETCGGVSIPNWVYKLTNELSGAAEGIIKAYNSLADTAYSAGKQLGSYIRNW